MLFLQQFLSSQYLLLPEDPGIYQFLDNKGKILYVGKAKNLKNRVSSYFHSSTNLYGKTAFLVSLVNKIRIIPVESEIEALLLEANLIKKYSPKYNIRLTDGKAYPLIRITAKAEYPAVVTARRVEDKNSVYFGPFPNSSAVRSVLRILRKTFGYQSTQNHQKTICLYHHLGLCPCASVYKTDEAKKEYKKTIAHIIDFLDGKTKKVIKELEKERNSYTKNELFEEALQIQKKIDQIVYITQPLHKPFEYETNPNLKIDLRIEEMQSLQDILSQHGVKTDFPKRIECYDNSNFQGSNPTSSMVVLTDGEIDKSQYRKFKIRTVEGPNDFASMREVLSRRLKHTEWDYPDLIVIDGGKGQVSAAKEAMQQFSTFNSQFSILPLIGLAKRDEIIITSDLKEIRLPKSSPALRLVMRIRDEAHRFAITFHRKLRSKNALAG